MPKKFATEASRNPLDLHPQTQAKALTFLTALAPMGISIKMLDTARSAKEQKKLYEQGRSKPGPKVTNAGPDDTYHTKRRAFDIALLRPDLALDWDWMVTPQAMARWEKIAAIAEDAGLKWGGRWKRQDLPHFEDQWCAKCRRDHKAKEFDEDGECRAEPIAELPIETV